MVIAGGSGSARQPSDMTAPSGLSGSGTAPTTVVPLPDSDWMHNLPPTAPSLSLMFVTPAGATCCVMSTSAWAGRAWQSSVYRDPLEQHLWQPDL